MEVLIILTLDWRQDQVQCGQHNLISPKQMIPLHCPAANVVITWPGLCHKYEMQSTITNSQLGHSPPASREFYQKLKPRSLRTSLTLHSKQSHCTVQILSYFAQTRTLRRVFHSSSTEYTQQWLRAFTVTRDEWRNYQKFPSVPS